MREHLQAAERATGRRSPLLDVPPLPAACADLWQLFLQLNRTRGSNGFGPQPLDEVRLLAWCQLHRQRLTSWEIETLFALDAAWLHAHQQAREAATTDAPRKP